jgi:hypothetical protein
MDAPRPNDAFARQSATRRAWLRVLSLVHHAHAAAPEFLDDAVVRNGLVSHASSQDSGCNVRDVRKTKSTRDNAEFQLATQSARRKLQQIRAHPKDKNAS